MRTLIVLLLAGCAYVPPEERYQQLPWAKVGVHEARALCTMEVQRNPLVGHSTCMRALGWDER